LMMPCHISTSFWNLLPRISSLNSRALMSSSVKVCNSYTGPLLHILSQTPPPTFYSLTTPTEKILLALKCLQAAYQINPAHPGLHERLIRFRKTRKFNNSQPLTCRLLTIPSRRLSIVQPKSRRSHQILYLHHPRL
jgi:hypothetical protein